MMAESDDPTHLSRACPICGERVPWQRYWLTAWIWARWPCKRCGTELRFAAKRRVWISLAGGLTAFLAGLSIPTFGPIMVDLSAMPGGMVTWIAMVAAVVTAVVVPLCLLDRVRVAPHGSVWYCRGCRYDLRGTVRAGRTICPECGRAIEQSIDEIAAAAAQHDRQTAVKG